MQFYENLYGEQLGIGPSWMIFLLIPLLRLTQCRQSESFEEIKILEVRGALNGNTAIELDGFSKAFFQACCDLVKENIMEWFQDFHARIKFVKILNVTFIASILRSQG